jgi:hypothetical protein
VAGGLVVPGWVDDQVADEFAGGGVDDADVQVVDEHEDRGSGVVAADAGVVERAADPQGEFAVGIDAVGADAPVGVGGPVAGQGFGPGLAGGGQGDPVGQRPVRPPGAAALGAPTKSIAYDAIFAMCLDVGICSVK